MKFVSAFLLIIFAAAPVFAGDLPDVPGAINPDVTQANIHQTVCMPGWSKTVRPPTSYTQPIKKALMETAGIPWSQSRDFELDHDISIEIGGSPTDRQNLWLESYVAKPWNAHVKDSYENFLHHEVCAGRMTLSAAQQEIATDWIAGYRRHPELPPVGQQP